MSRPAPDVPAAASTAAPAGQPAGMTATPQRPSRTRRLVLAVVFVAAAVALALAPLQATPYTNLQLTLIATYAVVILGLNLVTGYAGQISLGQSAFFGLGAYCGAIATVRLEWSLPVSFLVACVVPAILGALVAIPAVRLRGHALAIVTLTLPVVGVPLARRYIGVTGGSQGMSAPMGSVPEWTGLASDQWAYYVVVTVAALLFLLARNLVTGRLGRAFAIIRHNDVVAAAMGVSPRRYKAIAFVVAATYGGAAGWLYVYTVGFISPETLDLLLGVNLLSSMVVGGMGSVLGALLGGAFYVAVPVLSGEVSPAQTSLIYGAVLLLVVFFAPGGLAGVVHRLVGWLARTGRRRR